MGSLLLKRAAWLRSQLETVGDEPDYLYMYHPHFNIGIPTLDRINLQGDKQRIRQIVNDFTNIKHLFFGHVHRPVSGSWHGIPFSTVRGTNHQVQLDLKAEDYLSISHEPPAYCVILLEPQQTTVHFYDYLDDSFYTKCRLTQE